MATNTRGSMALVRTPPSTSVTIIAPGKSTLERSQKQKVVRILSPYMPDNFLTYMPIRRYGRNWGTPLWCPVCQRTVNQLLEAEGKPTNISHGRKSRYMRVHPYVAHV